LPGVDEAIDEPALRSLVEANRGKRGFTFTHKPWHSIIEWSNTNGFAINLSCDSVDEVDAHVRAKHRAPLTLVVPADAPQRWRTPDGNHVITCPAQTAHVTCEQCKLCAIPNRKSVIAFRAHGNSINKVSERAVQRRLPMVF
jgi:hypothetical protein